MNREIASFSARLRRCSPEKERALAPYLFDETLCECRPLSSPLVAGNLSL